VNVTVSTGRSVDGVASLLVNRVDSPLADHVEPLIPRDLCVDPRAHVGKPHGLEVLDRVEAQAVDPDPLRPLHPFLDRPPARVSSPELVQDLRPDRPV